MRTVGVSVSVVPGATVDGASVMTELDGVVSTGVLTEGLSWLAQAVGVQAVSAAVHMAMVMRRKPGMNISLSQVGYALTWGR